MQLHEITNKKTKKKRIGRGGKTGTYSGRGMKGQKSRAGHRMQPVIRQFIKRYHKLPGYRNQSQETARVVNISELNKFPAGANITPTELRKVDKILGQGELKKAIHVKGFIVSATAREKIEKAGGSVE